jgi:hypothetical protein
VDIFWQHEHVGEEAGLARRGVRAERAHGARLREQQARHELEQRRLAGAVDAEQAGDRAAL